MELFERSECPYIIKYYKSTQDNFEFKNRLMMDYLLGAENLARFLHSSAETISIAHKKLILTKVASALSFIHSREIIHMDLSLGNIFVLKTESIRILDFG